MLTAAIQEGLQPVRAQGDRHLWGDELVRMKSKKVPRRRQASRNTRNRPGLAGSAIRARAVVEIEEAFFSRETLGFCERVLLRVGSLGEKEPPAGDGHVGADHLRDEDDGGGRHQGT